MKPTPIEVVEAQLRAYNARDLDAWAATYAPDAEQYALHGELLARGRDAIRARSAPRFTEPDLHAVLMHRVAMPLGNDPGNQLGNEPSGAIVVDHERVTRNFPEGRGTIELVCVYEVRDGLIRRASFAFGEQRLDATQR